MRRIICSFLATTTIVSAEEKPDLPLVDISDPKDRKTLFSTWCGSNGERAL